VDASCNKSGLSGHCIVAVWRWRNAIDGSLLQGRYTGPQRASLRQGWIDPGLTGRGLFKPDKTKLSTFLEKQRELVDINPPYRNYQINGKL
jgi:hypothetical protein